MVLTEANRSTSKSFLRDSHLQKILTTYQEFIDVDRFASVNTIDQVAENRRGRFKHRHR